MPLDLPITVVVVDDHEHELARQAIKKTLNRIAPQQILIFTDDPYKIPIGTSDNEVYHHFNGRSVAAAARCMWYDVPPLVKTSHYLSIQADGWVLDESRWTDEFLEYDYIGAPWPIEPGNIWWRLGFTRGRNVGNGGFSLVSARFGRHVADNRDRYPLVMPGDDALCRGYRKSLEADGFRWAPEKLAAQFSFECSTPPPEGTFGFHGIFMARELIKGNSTEMSLKILTGRVS